MNILDKAMKKLDKREVVELRKKLSAANCTIKKQESIIKEQVSQIANANGRVRHATAELLKLKSRFPNEHGNSI